MTETDRLDFLVARDGREAARAWARQTLATYRGVLRARKVLTMYRRPLVVSCLTFRRVLRERA